MAWPDDVTRADLRIDTLRGSGAGGQHRNKRDTAVRIKHLPTGLVGYAEDQRSQPQNRKLAFRRLASQLVPLMKREAVRERYAAGQRRVRTYHEPGDRVVDERLPGQRWSYQAVVHGDGLQDIVGALAADTGKESRSDGREETGGN
jgi:protein subunit release factor A